MIVFLDDSYPSRAIKFLSTYIKYEFESPIHHKTLSDCTLPALIQDDGLVVSGLCHVARILISSASNACCVNEKKKTEALLGYKQNCLKACAVVSNWTRFCEVELPRAVHVLIQQLQEKREGKVTLPAEFVKLEKEFLVPKKTPNALKYFKGRKKDNLVARDNVETDIEPCSSIELVWSSCGFVKMKEAKIKKIDTRNSENPLEQVNCSKDIVWSYLCGLSMTVADLLVLSYFVEIMASVPLCIFQRLLKELPETEKWILRCFGKPQLFDAVQNVWENNCLMLDGVNGSYNDDVDSGVSFEIPSNIETIYHVTYVEKIVNSKQIHVKITNALPNILQTLSQSNVTTDGYGSFNTNKEISWNKLPDEVDPSGGELNPARTIRKRKQIENMASLITPLLKAGDKVVEFCAGGGHLGIVLAYLNPQCKFVLVDNKKESIDRAMSRIETLKLTNVTVYLSNLEYFVGWFNVGITLHACGTATDLVLKKCIQNRASFVVCPCCYGGIQTTTDVEYPKSSQFTCLKSEDYHLLAHSADQTNSNYESDYNKQGKNSMILIDIDRIKHAKEKCANYKDVNIYTMSPVECCSPKNNMIVGVSG